MKPRKKMKIILSLFAFLFFSTSIFASDIAMIIESLTVDLNITEDNQYQIKETYENNFIKQSHGFFREVATDYTSGDFYTIVKDAYCSAKMSEEVGTYSTIYKIGDADKYVNGKKDYIFGYTLDVGKNYHAETDGYDFIKYTLIQSSSYPIEKANFKITLPKEINLSDIHFASGKHGDTGFAGTFSLLEDNKTIIGSIENLDTQQNVTVGIELPVDYFEGQRDFFAILDIKFIISLIIPTLTVTL